MCKALNNVRSYVRTNERHRRHCRYMQQVYEERQKHQTETFDRSFYL